MRVILFVTDLERGGTPLRLARLARGLRDRDVEVHVGCLAPPGAVSRDLDEAGIATFSCNARRPWQIWALLTLVEHVWRIRPDLIHSTLTHANVAARLAGLLTRTPVITSTATIEVERHWHRAAERLTGGLDRGHLVNSRELAWHVQSAFGVAASRVHVVPPSIDAGGTLPPRASARAALGLAEAEFVVLWVGRLDPVKRVEMLVRCAEILTDVPLRVLLAGDGPCREAIEARIHESRAGDRVRLLGWQNDLARLWAAADVFCLPSLTEGMPNAVLEALAAGLPVVAADLPSLRELADGGCVLPVGGQTPESYADVLRELRAHAERRATLGARGAAWARAHLDADAAVGAVIEVYRKALHC